MLDAPDAGGLFLGDYYGLGVDGTHFIPLYTIVNTGVTSNRTDVYVDRVDAGVGGGERRDVAYGRTIGRSSGDGPRRRAKRSPATWRPVRAQRKAQWRAWLAAAAEGDAGVVE